MFDTTEFSGILVAHCLTRWPRDEVLSAFETLSEGAAPLVEGTAVTSIHDMISGLIIGSGPRWDILEGARAKMVAACLAEMQRTPTTTT